MKISVEISDRVLQVVTEELSELVAAACCSGSKEEISKAKKMVRRHNRKMNKFMYPTFIINPIWEAKNAKSDSGTCKDDN